MHRIAIMQPYLFPYLGYFQAMKAVDEYVIYDDVQFIKGGWINRNHLLVGGKRSLFTFALSGASPNKLITEVTLQGRYDRFIATLANAYARAPYKRPVLELVAAICANPDTNLARFVGDSLIQLAGHLRLATKFTYSSALDKDNRLRGQDKVIRICQLLGATHYVNAIGGQALYRHADFARAGVALSFLASHRVPYPQLGGPFVPDLSIIDVLMFNSPERICELLDGYELV